MIVKPFEVNLSKVKRLFTFGCSFTNFFWPTWAKVLSYELEDAKFYNFGRSGLGNLAISAKMSEANYRFNFSESDLVMVLWSTYLREDRWLKGSWFGAGNVFSTGMYDDSFRKNYADVCGYLIRDGAIIAMSKDFLEKLPCQVMMMPSVPFKYLDSTIEYDKKIYTQVTELYKPLFESMPKSLYEYVSLKGMWQHSHTYYWPEMKMMHNDNHPTPKRYCDYLNNNIVRLSDKTHEYAEQMTHKLLTLSTKPEICKEFEYDTKEYLLF